jgi:dihydrofolate reductase
MEECMRKIIVSSLVSLDGVVEDPGGFSGFKHGGWASPYFTAEAVQHSMQVLSTCDYFLCGRVTYEAFSKFWPQGSGPYADRLNSIPKLVASRTLKGDLEWNAKVIDGDVVEELKRIKAEDGGNILMYGSVNLMRTLMEHRLGDEYNFAIHPVALGSGQKLFGEGDRIDLKYVGQKTYDSGVVSLTYHPADA